MPVQTGALHRSVGAEHVDVEDRLARPGVVDRQHGVVRDGCAPGADEPPPGSRLRARQPGQPVLRARLLAANASSATLLSSSKRTGSWPDVVGEATPRRHRAVARGRSGMPPVQENVRCSSSAPVERGRVRARCPRGVVPASTRNAAVRATTMTISRPRAGRADRSVIAPRGAPALDVARSGLIGAASARVRRAQTVARGRGGRPAPRAGRSGRAWAGSSSDVGSRLDHPGARAATGCARATETVGRVEPAADRRRRRVRARRRTSRRTTPAGPRPRRAAEESSRTTRSANRRLGVVSASTPSSPSWCTPGAQQLVLDPGAQAARGPRARRSVSCARRSSCMYGRHLPRRRPAGPAASLPCSTHQPAPSTGAASAATQATAATGCRQLKLVPRHHLDGTVRGDHRRDHEAGRGPRSSRNPGQGRNSIGTPGSVTGTRDSAASTIAAARTTTHTRSTRARVSRRRNAARPASGSPTVSHAGASPGPPARPSSRSRSAGVGQGSPPARPASTSHAPGLGEGGDRPGQHEDQRHQHDHRQLAHPSASRADHGGEQHQHQRTPARPAARTTPAGRRPERGAPGGPPPPVPGVAALASSVAPRPSAAVATHGSTTAPATVPSRPWATDPGHHRQQRVGRSAPQRRPRPGRHPAQEPERPDERQRHGQDEQQVHAPARRGRGGGCREARAAAGTPARGRPSRCPGSGWLLAPGLPPVTDAVGRGQQRTAVERAAAEQVATRDQREHDASRRRPTQVVDRSSRRTRPSPRAPTGRRRSASSRTLCAIATPTSVR